MKLLSEIERIQSVMGIIKEDETKKRMNINLRKTVDILTYLKLYNKTMENMLMEISVLANEQVIDFGLLERGLRKILLKKGDKKKNVQDYLGKIVTSLKFRERSGYGSEPESEDYEFEIEEPSIIPKKVYKKELYEMQIELLKLQEWLKTTGKTVIIVFEGRDSAGKGSTIKKFTENMNPKGYKVIQLGIPTPEDRADWWGRYRKQIEPGKINLFDRSWYNRGLVEPVAGYGTPEEYEDFMENVENFENSLIENGDYLFKLWFSIDKETMAKRFKQRLSSPLKKWKYSPNDEKMLDLWDRFTEFKEKLFDKTSTVNHPWVILDSSDKRVSGLNAIRYVLQNIPYKGKNEEFLSKEYPEAITILRPE